MEGGREGGRAEGREGGREETVKSMRDKDSEEDYITYRDIRFF